MRWLDTAAAEPRSCLMCDEAPGSPGASFENDRNGKEQVLKSSLGTRNRRFAVPGLLVLASLTIPAGAMAGLKVYEKDDMTLELGMRLQTRMQYERRAALLGGGERDFMIRRARLKANGKIMNATYGFEWKIDATDQLTNVGTGAPVAPTAAVENAWVQYPIGKTPASVRAGLYDQPFSRDRLTSDSRQLAVDRGEVSNVAEALGLADNIVGLDVRGSVKGGRAQYVAGMYDNVKLPGRMQDNPMIVGRIDLNLGSTKDLYQDAHFGTDKWYSLGLNGGFQKLERYAGADSITQSNAGVDGMIDVPMFDGRVFVRGELNAIRRKIHGGPGDANTTLRMVEAGCLMFHEHLQPFVRFDQVRGQSRVTSGAVARDITYVGANLYQKGHSLKIQGDVRLESGTGEMVDGGRLQGQIDF